MRSAALPLLDALRSIVGNAHVLADGDLAAWEQDWRKRSRGRALAVVRPASTDQVAAVVRCLRQWRGANPHPPVSLIPQGGNTGLVLGSTPDASGTQIVLSLQRLQQIRQIDTDNLTMVVEAGCVLQQVQQAAEAQGLLFPLSMASQGSCTLGGNLASNAGGTQVLRYGTARELCLGLEVVTPQGEVWNGLSALRKDNTGYDLRNLYIGSEGTLGIITAAALKLFPQPAARLTAWACVPDARAALDLLNLARTTLDASLTAFEVMGNFALQLVARHFAHLRLPPWDAPYCVLLESSDAEGSAHAQTQLEQLLQSALDAALLQDAVVAGTGAQAQAMWHARESIPLAQPLEGLNIKHDIALPISALPDFIAETDAALQRHHPGVRMVNFGHFGDGNLHYNVQAPAGVDAAQFLRTQEHAINTLVYDAVARWGGSISAEHGIGSLKRDVLPHYKSAQALGIMRAIKSALDPDHLLNPGRVLPDAS